MVSQSEWSINRLLWTRFVKSIYNWTKCDIVHKIHNATRIRHWFSNFLLLLHFSLSFRLFRPLSCCWIIHAEMRMLHIQYGPMCRVAWPVWETFASDMLVWPLLYYHGHIVRNRIHCRIMFSRNEHKFCRLLSLIYNPLAVELQSHTNKSSHIYPRNWLWLGFSFEICSGAIAMSPHRETWQSGTVFSKASAQRNTHIQAHGHTLLCAKWNACAWAWVMDDDDWHRLKDRPS